MVYTLEAKHLHISVPLRTYRMSQSIPSDITEELDLDSPSGWMLLAGKQSRVKLINALLNMPPHREFNQTELAEFAHVSRKSVHTHLPVLDYLDIVEEVPDSSPKRYRFNTENEMSKLLIQLDGAVNNAGPFADE